MKKLYVILLVILGIGGVAVVSCPDKEAHQEAITAVLNQKLNETIDDDVCTLFYSALGAGVIKILVENRLTVQNHFLYSTGELLNLDGEYNQVSLGLFGHVFTFKKEDLDEALSEAGE
ncbi:MAG: DUF4359 domain-containing protein [Bacteroidales bacterium]|nr:DUF4359 domain-containing protein [Bacteroidales bacterium]